MNQEIYKYSIEQISGVHNIIAVGRYSHLYLHLEREYINFLLKDININTYRGKVPPSFPSRGPGRAPAKT